MLNINFFNLKRIFWKIKKIGGESLKMKKILLIIYGFYVIYLPNFLAISPLLRVSIVSTFLLLVNILVLNRKLREYMKFVKIIPVFCIYFSLIIYIGIIAALNGLPIFENIQEEFSFIIYALNILALLIYHRKVYGSEKEIGQFLILIGLIQTAIIFLMLLIPSFKDFAVLIYSNGDELDYGLQSILGFRIYGIGSSYTVMLPLLQGIFAVLSLFFYDKYEENKYIVYSLILIFSSVFNARTPVFIYIVILIAYLVKWSVNRWNLGKTSALILLFLSALTAGRIISKTNADSFKWITSGFEDLSNFLFKKEITGNFNALAGSQVFFPEKWTILFGIGSTVAGKKGDALVGQGSDIGYINHWFKGGLIYVVILYITHIRYIFKGINNRFLSVGLILYLLIANYKGEIMVSNMILLIVYLLVFENRVNQKYNLKINY